MRVRALLLVAALVAALVGFTQLPSTPATATSPSAPTPVVVGNRIVDSRTGNTFIPHGANWPSFEYACSEGWGYSQGGDTDAAAAAMVSWGINTVRLPLNEDCWLGSDASDYGNAADYQAAVAAWVSILKAHGIVVILDLHWTAPVGQHALGQYPMADAQSTTFWSSVAHAYADDPSVIFDLFNEPYSIWDAGSNSYSFELTWACWENGGCRAPLVNTDQQPITGAGAGTYTVVGMSTMVAAVRAAGAAQPIMLGGLDYSNDLSGWLAHKPDDSQLIASWHNYPGQLDCNTPSTPQLCWTAATSAVAASVPIITGEFGETDGGSSYLTEYMNWADAAGIGYLPWAWWDASGLTGAAKLYALYSGSNFTPQAPEGTAYKAHLASLGPLPVNERAFTGGPLPMTAPGIGSSSGAATAHGVQSTETGTLRLRARRCLRLSSR
jgi:endoglucanase